MSDDDGFPELDSDSLPYDNEELGEIRDMEGEEPNWKGKVKMGDYSGDDAHILDATVEGVSAQLLAHRWFLESFNYNCLILYTWQKKAANIASRPKKHPLTIQKLHLGRLKKVIKAASLVQYYKLNTGTQKDIAVWVENLTSDNQFHTKPRAPKGTGFYQDKFIQMAINNALFTTNKKRAPIAIKYQHKFKQMLLPTIVFICTLTQFLIDAQAHGKSTDDTIVRKAITKVYLDHLDSLKNIHTVDPDTIHTMQDCLFERGF
ncbi:hypothetical protein FRC10_002086 [Ceratobasidium sp. 414]|nr:hypothetical protein FRC10_002086 [Ceratobasidium sp. 414]